MITGAGRGLGRAFVQEAVDKGDCVIASVRKIPQDDALFRHENVFPVIMDVTRPDEIKAAVKSGMEHFGHIDYLINNAGYGMNGAFEEITDEKFSGPLLRPDQPGRIQRQEPVLHHAGCFTGEVAAGSLRIYNVPLCRAVWLCVQGDDHKQQRGKEYVSE